MPGQAPGHRGFVIDGLTRTGSTTLARLLSCHSNITCLIEPFHPHRYDGQFHRLAMSSPSIDPVLNLIWHRWTGIKHVWDTGTGWPFTQNPGLNDCVALKADRVISSCRRNLLRRYVSDAISKQLNMWIGTREEFCARLENVQLRELDPAVVAEAIQRDRAALQRKDALLHEHGIPTMRVFYEDLFDPDTNKEKQLELTNDILAFLGFCELTHETFAREWARILDPNIYRWSSAEIYRSIPGVGIVEQEVGSDETGWLFRGKS